jgi:hypothetical protein
MTLMEIARLAVLLAAVSATSFAAGFFFTKYLIDHHYVTVSGRGGAQPQ